MMMMMMMMIIIIITTTTTTILGLVNIHATNHTGSTNKNETVVTLILVSDSSITAHRCLTQPVF